VIGQLNIQLEGFMSRNGAFIRDSSGSSSSWLEEFASEWEKKATTTAVDEARKRQAELDFYSQISSIVGGKRKHATVDSIVQEYQELTGLKKYLQTLAEQDPKSQEKIKTAQYNSENNSEKVLINVNEDMLPSDMSDTLKEQIKTLINNKIETYNGFISIPAIQDDLLKSLKHQGIEAHQVYDSNMVKFIGNCLRDYQEHHPRQDNHNPHLGEAIIEIEDDGKFMPTLQKK
jgi:hypothetical protein